MGNVENIVQQWINGMEGIAETCGGLLGEDGTRTFRFPASLESPVSGFALTELGAARVSGVSTDELANKREIVVVGSEVGEPRNDKKVYVVRMGAPVIQYRLATVATQDGNIEEAKADISANKTRWLQAWPADLQGFRQTLGNCDLDERLGIQNACQFPMRLRGEAGSVEVVRAGKDGTEMSFDVGWMDKDWSERVCRLYDSGSQRRSPLDDRDRALVDNLAVGRFVLGPGRPNRVIIQAVYAR